MYSPPIKYDDFLQKFPTEAKRFSILSEELWNLLSLMWG